MVIAYTTDPTSGAWTLVTTYPFGTADIYRVAYGNGYWVAVSRDYKIAICSGAPSGSWTLKTISSIWNIKSVYFGANAWVICGQTTTNTSRIVTCGANPNGTWTVRQSYTTAFLVTDVYYYNCYWVVVGYNGQGGIIAGRIATAVPGV